MGAETVDDALESVLSLRDLLDLFPLTEVITETSFQGIPFQIRKGNMSTTDLHRAIF